jgi:hypothetical protein
MRASTLALAVGLLLAAGCDKTATFSYFNVHVTLDRSTIDDELLDLIQTCAVTADGPVRQDISSLRCTRHRIPNDLGVFQYTTKETKGSVTFKVIMTSYFDSPLAEGSVGPIGIAPGSSTDAMLVVSGIPGAPRMPPGIITPTDDASARDAAADLSAPDAPPGDGATPDGAGDVGSDATGDATD